jgi:3-dehydrotetronate 4-kinase
MLLGCIADDFTGASDLANTLTKEGMPSVQFVGIPDRAAPADCHAGIVALKTRTIPVREAIAQSLAALDWLLAQGCQQILFKYCSTFDSTKEGNIGPVAEALLERLGGSAVVCPVFPATGRTLFNGYLFVNGQPLNETGMRDHPLTPMTDANIRRWLQCQTKLPVGLVGLSGVRKGAHAIRLLLKREAEAGRRLIVIDATEDDDLRQIGGAIADNKLITGGSGIALGLPANFRRAGLIGDAVNRYAPTKGPGVALSGSCSQASLAQVAEHAKTHPALMLDPDDIMADRFKVADALAWVTAQGAKEPIISSSAAPETVQAAQKRYGREAVSEKLETFMGQLASALVAAGFTRIAVGGGETSGAVVKALKAVALGIGPEIDPGVPALMVEGSKVRIALKSGNFGAPDFYAKALKVLGSA